MLSTPALKDLPDLDLYGISCTASGYLIVSAMSSPTLFAIDIASGQVEPIHAAPSSDTTTTSNIKLRKPSGLTLDEADRSVFVADVVRAQIISISLPARYFTTPEPVPLATAEEWHRSFAIGSGTSPGTFDWCSAATAAASQCCCM